MGTFRDKLSATKTSVDAIAAALNERGAAVDSATPLSSFSTKIREIRGGEFHPDGYKIIVNASTSTDVLDGCSMTVNGTVYPLTGAAKSVDIAVNIGEAVSVSFGAKTGFLPPDDVAVTITADSFVTVITAVFAPCAARIDVGLKNADGSAALGQEITVGSVTKVVTGTIMHFAVAANTAYNVTVNELLHAQSPSADPLISGEANSVKSLTMQYKAGVRYGIRVMKAEPNPDTRVEYLYDAVGMTPAKMNYTSEAFEYGSWEALLADICKPCMVNYDLTIRGELSLTDHTKYKDGTASGISDFATPANAMSVFKKWYLNLYEDDIYEYFLISNIKWDENYCDYHCYNELGAQEYMMLPMFAPSLDGTRLRSIAGKTRDGSRFYAANLGYAKANGAGWNLLAYSKLQFRNALLKIISKSTNSQASFGMGNNTGGVFPTGSMMTSGMFSGKNIVTAQVKVLWCEAPWAERSQYIVGMKANRKIGYFVKMKPPYDEIGAAGYTCAGMITVDRLLSESVIVKNVVSNELGCFPLVGKFSSPANENLYDCDAVIAQDSAEFTTYGATLVSTSKPASTGISSLEFFKEDYKSIYVGGSLSA